MHYTGRMTFASMNDSYYQPADDRGWDIFVDYCESNGLNPDDEDFDEWAELQADMADDAAAERALDYAMEDRYDDGGW